ncbi:hypothetical protein F7725_010466 [Dissostichus mawsoni]|uniref:Ig-like domain-containing protein n=1 Tax=Dissostichus mawsoni TaxID=36200 RepID=A0A7J5XRJ1_DISMA|nr:hypothetical protein F7725_010466 [Dissostichus mawsoni]
MEEDKRNVRSYRTLRRVVYHFSKNFSSSDAGTYFCAVATCGEILFGYVTKLKIDWRCFLLLPSLVSAISVIVIAILIHAIKKNKCDYCHNKESEKRKEKGERNANRLYINTTSHTPLYTLIQTAEDSHQISLTRVELGGNLTLTCSVFKNEARMVYWYKLKFGYMFQTVAAGTFDKIQLQGQFNNSRFNITKLHAQNILNIRNVAKEDEATYFCQAGSAYKMEMINGTLLVVNDHKNRKKSIYVKQSPKTKSVQPGDSVTLQCSLLSKNKESADQCPGEHNVYWFRSGSGESQPSIIYTHSEEQKERSCVFSLSKTIHNSSDTGTYYCAVATCGQILFGEGTTVETIVLVLGALLACSLTLIVILTFYVNRGVCRHCKDYDLQDGDEEAVNYAALNYSTRKMD